MLSRAKAPTPAAQGYFMPAEWAPHRATWLTWPASRDWPDKLPAVRWVYTEIIRRLTAFENVALIVGDSVQRGKATRMLTAAGVDTRRVEFFTAPTNRTWARDNLPLFVTNRRTLGAVKWRFNGWARYANHQLDDQCGIKVAKRCSTHWFPEAVSNGKRRRVVLEGGSIDVDGEGTLLTTRRCLLGSPFTRNPGLDQAAVEQILQQYLGVQKTLWVEDGIAGDDTSGHVDDFARFVGPGRVVIAQETDARDENYAPLNAAREVLESARDAKGRKLEVVRLPMPEPVHYRGERLPASYANFYVANHQLLVPTFNDPKDRLALGILAELFPERAVVGIHATDLVVGLGTLHCSTQQEPEV